MKKGRILVKKRYKNVNFGDKKSKTHINKSRKCRFR